MILNKLIEELNLIKNEYENLKVYTLDDMGISSTDAISGVTVTKEQERNLYTLNKLLDERELYKAKLCSQYYCDHIFVDDICGFCNLSKDDFLTGKDKIVYNYWCEGAENG
jgi:hypothetical protein